MTIFLKRAASVALCIFAPMGVCDSSGLKVYAGYDYTSPNYNSKSYFYIDNKSSATLSNIVFTVTGDGSSAANTDTGTWTWPSTVAAGTIGANYLPGSVSEVTGKSYGFLSNYGFTYGGNDQSYKVTAVLNGQTYTARFSPSSNASGAFVGFLGNDSAGDYLPADVSSVVASLVPATLNAAYEDATGLAIIQDVLVDQQHYYVLLQAQSDGLLSLKMAIPIATQEQNEPAEYALSNQVLTVPRVQVAGKYYKVTLTNVGNLSFQINSVTEVK